MSNLRASLCLDGIPTPELTSAERVAQQLQIVLNTRPGQIPWRPEFGCDLSSLVGQPATRDNVRDARSRVEAALRSSLPDLDFDKCEVRLTGRTGGDVRHPSIPLAEAALLALGVQAGLEISLEVRVPEGPVAVTADVDL